MSLNRNEIAYCYKFKSRIFPGFKNELCRTRASKFLHHPCSRNRESSKTNIKAHLSIPRKYYSDVTEFLDRLRTRVNKSDLDTNKISEQLFKNLLLSIPNVSEH